MDCRHILWIGEAEQTTAATGAAHFCGTRAGCECAGNERLDHRRGHTRRQLLARLPFEIDLRSDAGPIAAAEGIADAAGGLDDAIEALEDVAVAVHMALHDFPVVRAGEVRGAG